MARHLVPLLEHWWVQKESEIPVHGLLPPHFHHLVESQRQRVVHHETRIHLRRYCLPLLLHRRQIPAVPTCRRQGRTRTHERVLNQYHHRYSSEHPQPLALHSLKVIKTIHSNHLRLLPECCCPAAPTMTYSPQIQIHELFQHRHPPHH